MVEQTRDRPETLTLPRSPRWLDRPDGYRHFESAFFVGRGRATFDRCAEDVLHWKVKTRSGFDIGGSDGVVGDGAGDVGGTEAGLTAGSTTGGSARPPRVRVGQEPTILVRLGPFRLPEPSRVVDVLDAPDRCGFTYGTKPGHPLTGEESFILIRTPDDRVFLVLRSVSRPGLGFWRFGEPFIRLAQLIYRRRYSRALRASL